MVPPLMAKSSTPSPRARDVIVPPLMEKFCPIRRPNSTGRTAAYLHHIGTGAWKITLFDRPLEQAKIFAPSPMFTPLAPIYRIRGVHLDEVIARAITDAQHAAVAGGKYQIVVTLRINEVAPRAAGAGHHISSPGVMVKVHA